MPINSKYVFVASMDVDLHKEDLFNEVYDTEHIPNLLNVPGVRSATRVKGEPFAMSIGGGNTSQQTSKKRNGGTNQQTNKRNGSTSQRTSNISDRRTN